MKYQRTNGHNVSRLIAHLVWGNKYRPSQNISNIVKLLKGRTSRKLQIEFPVLKQRYWGRHFWAIDFGC